MPLAHEVLAFYPPDQAREYALCQLALCAAGCVLSSMSDKIERFWLVSRARQGRQAHAGARAAETSALH